MTTTATSPQLQVVDLVFAKVKTHALGVFAELRIADLLAEGPRSAESLAQATVTRRPRPCSTRR
jgi:hypothetical protein